MVEAILAPAGPGHKLVFTNVWAHGRSTGRRGPGGRFPRRVHFDCSGPSDQTGRRLHGHLDTSLLTAPIESRRSSPFPAVAVVICAAMAGLYLWFVHAYGVNVPFEDEWHMVTLLASVHRGQLNLGLLWAQHNENRMLFAYLLLLALELTSRFDTVVEMYCSAALLLVALLAVWRVHARAGGAPWALVPAVLVLLSLAQFTVALQGFALAIYLVLACFAVGLWLLEASSTSVWLLGLAAVIGIVASYSSIQGLAVWPAGIAYLIARNRSPRTVVSWTAVGVITSAVYLIGFNWSLTGGGGFRAALVHPTTSLHYLALLAGSVVPESSVLHLDLRALSALGVVLLLAAAAAYLLYWRIRPAPEMALALSLITLGLVVDILNTLGRAGEGVSYANSGRYVVFNLWLLAGLWLATCTLWRRLRMQSALPSLALIAAGVVVALQITLSIHAGLVAGRDLHRQREVAVHLVDRYQTAPPGLVEVDVYPSYPVFRQRAAILRQLHLSVFAGSS